MKPEQIAEALKLATPSQLAAALASRTSEAKKISSRENGKKGGWPKGRKRKLPDSASQTEC